MPPALEIILPNRVCLSFYPENTPLEKMVELAGSLDFLKETEIMKKVGSPMNLLVYDEFLALGLYHTKNKININIRPYSDKMLLNWIDLALSLRKHPIRVIDKTSQKLSERLKPRIELDWIEYDPSTQVIREIQNKPCPAQRFLESMPPNRDLYSLAERRGRIEVIGMRINYYTALMDKGKTSVRRILCESQGTQLYDLPMEEAEKKLKEAHPNALILREPLLYCSYGEESKPWACLARLFETVYAKKIGFKGKVNADLEAVSCDYPN